MRGACLGQPGRGGEAGPHPSFQMVAIKRPPFRLSVRPESRRKLSRQPDHVRSRWAICVGTSGPVSFARANPPSITEKSTDEEKARVRFLSRPEKPHAARIREGASNLQEPVLAIVSYHLLEWRIQGHPVKVMKHCVVACRPSCRASGNVNVMKELFAMCRDRALAEGASFGHVLGIPNYCELRLPASRLA